MKKSKILFLLIFLAGSFVHAVDLMRFNLGIDGNGNTVLRINETIISKETGERTLKRLAKLSQEQTILIVVQPEVKIKELFEFLNQVKSAGLKNIDVIITSKSDDESLEINESIVLEVKHVSITDQIIKDGFKIKTD